MSNEPFDPSRANEPELMRQSKARPPSGDLDYAKFAPKKSGAAPAKSGVYDSSKYMDQLREEDPWPDEDAFQDRHVIKVTLVTCEITTAVADLKFDRPVHARCQLQILSAPDDLSVRLRLQHATSAAGPWTDLPEVVSRSITAAPANQTVETDLQLSTPNPEPAFGADVFYRAVAINNQATTKESAAVSLKYVKLTEFVGEPEVGHAQHSLLPRVGDDGLLIRALGAYLAKVAAQPPATADKAVVFGFSHHEADLKKNRVLSKARAEVLKSVLDHDITLWKVHKTKFTLSDTQQILTDLHKAFGWNCDPGPVDGIDGPLTQGGVRGFQNECNTRYNQGLNPDGVCGPLTWDGVHRALCALVAKELNPAFADPAVPAWQVPDWHYPPGKGAYPCGADFPPPTRSAELNLFHPSDAPVLATPTDAAALTIADNPVEDPAKYRKEKIPVRAAGAAALPADRAVPTIETYDPAQPVTESGTNPGRVERSGQVVEIRQWVNLTTKDDGRDGKGSKIKLRIRSRDAIRDEANAKALPDQVFLKVVYSADGGPANRVSRSDAPNNFSLVATANLAGVVNPTAASLQRAATGGWQTAPAAPWEHTATINTAGAKMVEIELDVGLCGGDTCEVQVGSTNACDSARVRFVNWRKVSYELLVPDCLQTEMDTAVATHWDFQKGLKDLVDQRLGAGFVKYELLDIPLPKIPSHTFTKAEAGANTWVSAAFVKKAGRDRYIYASGWPAPTWVAPKVGFDAAPNSRTMQVTLCDRSFSSDPIDVAAVKDATAQQSDYAVNDLGATLETKNIYAFPTSPKNNAPSVDVTGMVWTAQVVAAQHQVTPIATTTLASDPAIAAHTYRLEILAPDNSAATSRSVLFPAGSSALPGSAQTAIVQLVTFALEKGFRYRCATRIRFVIKSVAGDPLANGRNGVLQTALRLEFDARKTAVAYHPGLDADGHPRTGAMNAAWFSHPDFNTLRLTLPRRASANDPFLPGDFAGAKSPTHCPVTWRATVTRTYSINGNSGGGKQILVMGRPTAPNSSTICHELGHSMGLAAFINGLTDRCANAPGMISPKHVDNGGRAYINAKNAPFDKGRRKLHKGGHCAANIPNVDLPHETFHGKDGNCIMFGQGGNSDTRPGFCPDCIGVLKARTLEDIRTAWTGRY